MFTPPAVGTFVVNITRLRACPLARIDPNATGWAFLDILVQQRVDDISPKMALASDFIKYALESIHIRNDGLNLVFGQFHICSTPFAYRRAVIARPSGVPSMHSHS